MTTPVSCFDFTAGTDYITKDKLIEWLKTYCKKWCFQEEIGDSGFRHFQGRVSLRTKKRLSSLINISPANQIHWSITSKGATGNNLYVTKEDTRVDGPWSDKDVPLYIPRQIREIKVWRPWQQAVLEKSKIWDTRTIDCIIDKVGNIGKSVLVTYMGVHKLACQIPFANDYKDVLSGVMDRPKRGCYLVDMPRALKKEKLFQLYSALESIKSGYAFDPRYSFKEEYFDSPNIWVFTNNAPDTNLLSRDRWRFWEIIDQHLVPYQQTILLDCGAGTAEPLATLNGPLSL